MKRTSLLTPALPPTPSTPLQEVLLELAAVFQHAIDRLDERGLAVFVDIAARKVARENARRLDHEWRRAA